MSEYLHAYIPDGIVLEQYTDPDFWLSGAFIGFETETVRMLPIGLDFLHWVWEATEHESYGLAQEACSLVIIPQQATPFDLIHHAWDRPREMYFMKGVISMHAQLPPEHRLHLSMQSREQMAEFAHIHPYLIDVLKTFARYDFQGFNDSLLTTDELRLYHRMPGPQFKHYDTYFPWLVDEIYQSVERSHDGVFNYEIRPVSEEFAQLIADK